MNLPLKEDLDSRSHLTEVDADLVEDISTLIEDGEQGSILNIVADLYPADLALLLTHLAFDDASQLFRWLPEEQAGDVLPELDDEYRADLLEVLSTARISALIDELDTDDAADVLADLPDAVVQDVLPQLEDEQDLRGLLKYDEETAGGIMETDFVAVREHMTVKQATEEIRRNAEEVDPIYSVYAIGDEGQLVGLVPLKRLLLAAPTARVREVMKTDIVSVKPDVDQEEVALVMERYDFVALPVVDHKNRLVGRITIDDIVDVIREEAEEDMQRMSGTSDEELTFSVFKISQARLVWLFIGLVGALLSGLVIKNFEAVLEEVVVLAMFIPVVMAMAGNAGIQSSSIAVQGLASGELWTTDLLSRIGKELLVSLLNGLVLAVTLGVLVLVLEEALQMFGTELAGANAIPMALTAAISLLIVIVLSTTIGATVPLLLDRFKIDPAIATGPFITTSNDILGLIVYFLVAAWMFPGLSI